MFLKSRKFLIWVITVAAVLVVYLLYVRLSKTPSIKVERKTGTSVPVKDFEKKEIGMVTETVGVGTVNVARFTDLDPKTRQVEREWGFEKLLHKTEDEWELEKPFMNIFQSALDCYIDADRGWVTLESGVDRPNAKDAIFTGNVIIRIFPANDSSVKESIIYLDDITYISEKSQFSTDGPVKFVSEDAILVGRGLELVYNEELSRMELLRVVHLDNLWIKTESDTALVSEKRQTPKKLVKVKQEKVLPQPTVPLKPAKPAPVSKPAQPESLAGQPARLSG